MEEDNTFIEDESIVLEDSGNNRRFGVTRKGELIK